VGNITTFLKRVLTTANDVMHDFIIQTISLHLPADGQVLMMKSKGPLKDKRMLMEEEPRCCVKIAEHIWATFLKEKD